MGSGISGGKEGGTHGVESIAVGCGGFLFDGGGFGNDCLIG